MKRSLKAMNGMRQRVDVYNALSQDEIHAWWRDWITYLEAHQTLLRLRQAHAHIAFVFEQDSETSDERDGAETRLRAIDPKRRAVFDTVRDAERHQAQQEAEHTARQATTGVLPSNPDTLELAIIARLLGEARGVDNDGQGWVPLAPEEDAWLLVDVGAIDDAPSAAAYMVQAHSADEQRRAFVLMGGAIAAAVLGIAIWAFWPARAKPVVRRDGPPIVANAAAVAPWLLSTLTVTATNGEAWTLPVSDTTELSWPVRAEDAAARAFWRTTTPLPVTLCLPNQLLAGLQAAQISSAGDLPVRVYGLSAGTPAAGGDLLLVPCAPEAKNAPPARSGTLRLLQTRPDQPQNQPVFVGANTAITVTSVTVTGAGDDPTLPGGQAAVTVHVSSNTPLDWPAHAPTLHLLSGTSVLPANPDQATISATLRYLVPTPPQATDVVWTVTPPATGQALRWRFTLDAPPDRLAVLRERLDVTDVRLGATTPERITVRVMLHNRSSVPLTLSAADLLVTDGERPVELPALPALQTPIPARGTTTLEFVVPRARADAVLTMQIGAERFAVQQGGSR